MSPLGMRVRAYFMACRKSVQKHEREMAPFQLNHAFERGNTAWSSEATRPGRARQHGLFACNLPEAEEPPEKEGFSCFLFCRMKSLRLVCTR